jgi:hypothetical protein
VLNIDGSISKPLSVSVCDTRASIRSVGHVGKSYGQRVISHLAADATVICDVGDWTKIC